MPKALIIGITGQDGSYLSEFLLEKGYEVHGVIRRASDFNTKRIDHIFDRIHTHFGDLSSGFDNLIYKIKPDEIYNLGAMSHVKVSFDIPEYTGNVTALGVCRVLETLRQGISSGLISKNIRYYQASSSELYGQTPTPISGYDESSPINPVSPYACAKAYSYFMTKTYRTGYGIYAVNGILFNHESSRRGPTFVTRKITRAAARIKLKKQDKLILGNLDSLRDWGHAKDYIKAMWLMLQQENPDDYVVATGEQYSVKDFLKAVFEYHEMNWEDHVVIDKSLFRPNEVPNLLGNSSKIRSLGWKPEYDFKMLVHEMCKSDLILEGT